MQRTRVPFVLIVCSLFNAAAAHAQTANYPYVLKRLAGNSPLGDGGPATQALLFNPYAVTVDNAGNFYVLDSSNKRIRKFTLGGNISTVAQLPAYPYDMKLGPDGNFYVTISAQVLKVTPSGVVSVVAGTGAPGAGTGGAGEDGIAATASEVTVNTFGIALDAAGNVYFVDQSRVREVTVADGIIHTVAGNTQGTKYNGDNMPATSANLNFPGNITLDSSGNLYIADFGNSRIRKVSAGTISTIAGTGLGVPAAGPATSSPLGEPLGLAVDTSGNVYFTDYLFSLAFEITKGTLTQIAGSSTWSNTDGPANGSYLQEPFGMAVDSSGNVFIAERYGNRVREVANGNIQTIAGELHFGGDGGPATSALLYEPLDLALDTKGDLFIEDSFNFRVREVTPDSNIRTLAGTGIFGSPLRTGYVMTMDASGNLYYASAYQVIEIAPNGTTSVFAGTGVAATAFGANGDAGPAAQATFGFIRGLAADSAGNIYIGDAGLNRVRKVTASTGVISNFAGSVTGKVGYSGDFSAAGNAFLNLQDGPVPLAVDQNGKVYIGDWDNFVIRVVDTNQIITTVVGNGTLGAPADGAKALSSPFPGANGLTVDASGQIYAATSGLNTVYRIDTAGVLHVISGGGSGPLVDGALGTSTVGFGGAGIRVDTNGDAYVADTFDGEIWKLILNSPTTLTISSGNNQSEPAGSALPVKLAVTLTGRAAAPLAGVTVSFSVTVGSAVLSASSATTDANGNANVTLTLGAGAGTVSVVASASGTSVAAVHFTETAVPANPNCPIGPPSISSVKSATDFGGFSTFAPGSWLEVKGSNLTPDASARQWGGADFQGVNAPTSLDGSSVNIDGNAGFVSYISSGQINVQAPADSNTGPVQITVTTCGGTSAPVTVQEAAISPGMLAPSSFNIGGKQYMAATFTDGVTYVGTPGLIAGVAFRAAKPGDIIIGYGVGFGTVSPPIAPGVIVGSANSVPGLTISFGSTPATVTYGGLAANFVGLYEFYITVPNVPNGDYQINISAGSTQVQQTLYLTVQQ